MMTRTRTQLLLQLAAAFLLVLGVQARTWTLAVADLDGVAGKVCDLKPDGSFRFLKQDVQIDPETGKGQAWFAAYAGKDVEIVQREDRKNLAGLNDPVIAVFTGFDDANAKALKDGESFRADHIVLRPDLKEAAGISDDGQTLTAWFTPRQARFSRDGVIKLGDKEIPGGVKGGGVRIAIAQQRSLDDLKEGSWRATLSGKLESGRFVVDKMQLNPLPDQVSDDDPKLPRVLSIGDSISMNYEQAARENLKGIANYHRITDNSWSTDRCKSFVSYWMGDYTKPGRGWDVILFNSGLHDMKQKELGGAYAMPLDNYRKNLRIWIEQMKPTGATLMYVTTTPVQNDSGSANYAFRTKGAEDDFNNAAREVLKDYPEILICDLAADIDNSPEFDNWRKGRDVHFWKAGEQALVGKAVAGSVKKALEVRRRRNQLTETERNRTTKP
jgi:hypothetical protein